MKHQKKILHIYNYSPGSVGFSDEQVVNSEKNTGVNKAFARLNAEGEYYSEILYFTRDKKKTIENGNLKFHFFPVNFQYLPANIRIGKYFFGLYSSSNEISLSALKYLQSEKFDLFVFHLPNSLFPLIVANLFKTPYCIYHRGGQMKYGNFRKNFFYNARNSFFTSNERREKAVEIYGLDYEKTEAINSSIDIDLFKPSLFELKEKKNINLLFIGRFDKQKGIDKLCAMFSEVLKNNSNVILTLIGSWHSKEFENEIRQFINNNNMRKNIIIKEWLDYHLLPEEYYKADLFVLPLQSNEPGPRTLCESLACGTPVLVTDCSDMAKNLIIDETCGKIVDKTEFQNALIEYVKSPDKLRKQINPNVFSLIKNDYSFEACYRKLKKRLQ